MSAIEKDFDRLARLDDGGWTHNNHYSQRTTKTTGGSTRGLGRTRQNRSVFYYAGRTGPLRGDSLWGKSPTSSALPLFDCLAEATGVSRIQMLSISFAARWPV